MKPKKETQNRAKGFTDEERAAMKERVQELKAEASAKKADGETDVLAKIAEMPEPDCAMAQRLHAIIKASAPALTPRTWYGMPAYAKARRSSRRDMRRWASAIKRSSMKEQCGQLALR